MIPFLLTGRACCLGCRVCPSGGCTMAHCPDIPAARCRSPLSNPCSPSNSTIQFYTAPLLLSSSPPFFFSLFRPIFAHSIFFSFFSPYFKLIQPLSPIVPCPSLAHPETQPPPQFHWQNYDDKAYLDALDHLRDMRSEGTITAIGLCNFDSIRTDEICTHLGKGVVVSNQVQVSVSMWLKKRGARQGWPP
ncbi:aldo/keto reductase family domain-containing protein [Rhizoctonia solani AG-1 IA]|uniref:Aldo/keto reductase family domain-containing protein n=1 Tax=Thanatephorus cucumeris (strain AG1-IA) TaxID=983506 RepID=L8WP80_THACA|nr:aldo/keto reductase family domain-containing protein [Rhizoctonia solani AG-1 IA]